FAGAVDDSETVLTLVRSLRALGDGDARPLPVIGFSRGAEIAYALALHEAALPACRRQVRGLVVLDMYYRIAPADEALRHEACQPSADEKAQLDGGLVAADNPLFSALGQAALGAPAAASDLLPGLTNAQALELLAGQTYQFFAPTPLYHLDGTAIVD